MIISIPSDVPVIEIARAFATIGYTLTNDTRGNLVARRESADHPNFWPNRIENAARAFKRIAERQVVSTREELEAGELFKS